MEKLIECVPNFSEGRDKVKIEKIVDVFRAEKGVKLLDYSSDKDHNRMVVTIIGSPSAVKKVLFEAVEIAINTIDLNNHKGEHPRMGVVDVIPFIPIRNISMSETVEFSIGFAKELANRFQLPVYLYESSASSEPRRNLANVRKGEFEGLATKMRQAGWKPDFGGDKPHVTAGAVAVGARQALIAYNINLNTDRLDIAEAIAKKIRHSDGGLRFCKAMGVELKSKGIVQVSMNLTDYTKTSIYQVFEMTKMEAKRYGITVAGSELIGLAPLKAIIDTAAYYLGLENLSAQQILESASEL